MDGKILEGEKFGKFGEDAQLAKTFPANTSKYSETTENMTSDSPSFPCHLLHQ